MITATLKNWRACTACFGGLHYHGQIYDDINKRWENGHRIVTSTVMSGPDNDIITTRNSTYKLCPLKEES